jgi:beta-galactosidase
MNNSFGLRPRMPQERPFGSATSALAACLLATSLLVACGGGGGSSSSTSPTAIAPGVTTPPAAASVTTGQAATFSVVASGTAPLTYQWQSNGTDIPGATGATYTTPATTAQMSGQAYDVLISNAAGTVTSASATLTVTGAPAPVACASVPAAPGGLVATAASASAVTVGWAVVSAPANCTVSGYSLYASTQSGFTPSASNLLATGIAALQYTSTGLAASTTYYYVVRTLDAQGASTPSAQVSATTLAAPGTGTGTVPTIATAPASQTVSVGTTATFSVVAGGTGPFSYQWQKNGVAIAGATAASYSTPTTSAPDNGASFDVVVSNASGPVTSAGATLTVNSAPTYTVYPGFIGTDLNNNTHGAWADNQIYIEILGSNISTGALSWVGADGTVTAASVADNTAANAVTGPNGRTYPNYAFTLAQSHLLKLPPLNGGRIYVSLGAPMYIPVVAGNPLGYAGPNPLNTSDPNSNTHYDWYEFDWGGTTDALFINTTQVDDFGLPLTLDVWGSNNTFHQQTGITESIAALDQEYIAQTPAIFQAPQSGIAAVSPLRIWAPAHMTFSSGGANGHYLDSYVNAVWTQYASTPLTVFLNNNSHEYTGTTSGTTFNFTEVDLHNGAYAGPQTYSINKPSTQDLLLCSGSMAFADSTLTGQEVSVTLALEAQFCAAFNRHVMDNYAGWTLVPDYYQSTPANYYAAFWHAHSIGGLSYGFAYDDVDNQSSSIVGAHPEHMAFGISY